MDYIVNHVEVSAIFLIQGLYAHAASGQRLFTSGTEAAPQVPVVSTDVCLTEIMTA